MVEHDRITQDKIIEINAKVEAIDNKLALLLASTPQAMEYIKEIFGGKESWARIYLAVDGKRTLDELSQVLGIKKQNVSTPLCRLQEAGLVEPVPGEKLIYRKSRPEKIFKISKFLKEKFSI